MADLLFRVRNKESSGNVETDELQFKRGDVVAIVDAGHVWSARELTNPDWRILRLPLVTAADLQELLRAEYDAAALNEVKTLRRKRRSALDLESTNWPNPVLNWILDDTRTQPILSRNFTREQILAFVTAKVPRLAFKVFG